MSFSILHPETHQYNTERLDWLKVDTEWDFKNAMNFYPKRKLYILDFKIHKIKMLV